MPLGFRASDLEFPGPAGKNWVRLTYLPRPVGPVLPLAPAPQARSGLPDSQPGIPHIPPSNRPGPAPIRAKLASFFSRPPLLGRQRGKLGSFGALATAKDAATPKPPTRPPKTTASKSSIRQSQSTIRQSPASYRKGSQLFSIHHTHPAPAVNPKLRSFS